MSHRPEHLKGLLDSRALAALREQLTAQERLLAAVRTGLPEFLALRCRHCVLKDQRLLVYVDMPAFAAQIRFYAPSLRTHLEQTGAARVRDIQVRNLLPVSPMNERARPARATSISAAVGDLLRDAADSRPSDEIRDALLRLGRTLRGLQAAEKSVGRSDGRESNP